MKNLSLGPNNKNEIKLVHGSQKPHPRKPRVEGIRGDSKTPTKNPSTGKRQTVASPIMDDTTQ